MEKCQRNPEDIQKYGPLTEGRMERRAKVRGLLASVSTTSDGKKRMEFVKRGFNAAINLRRCAVLENKPPDWTRRNLVGQSLKGELYERKLEAVVGSQSKKTGGGAVCTPAGDDLSKARSPPLLRTAGVVRLRTAFVTEAHPRIQLHAVASFRTRCITTSGNHDERNIFQGSPSRQITYTLYPLWTTIVPYPEKYLCELRVPVAAKADLQLEFEEQAATHYRNWAHAVLEDGC